jgi:uncharacterized protein YigE (DUF2233 family)
VKWFAIFVSAFFLCSGFHSEAFGQTPDLPPPAQINSKGTKSESIKPARTNPIRINRTLAPGVELIQEITPDGTVGGPLIVTALRVDLKAKGVRIEAALGQDRVWGDDPTLGREIVSTLAARRGAIAGINAGFFPFMGNPIGLHIQNGEMVTEPTLERTCFLLTKSGTGKIASFRYRGVAEVLEGGEKGESHAIDGMNRKPGKGDELLLFTPIFFDRTLKASGRVEVALTGVSLPIRPDKAFTGKVIQIIEGGGTPLPPDTVVFSGGGEAAEFLRRVSPGTHIRFRLETPTVRGEVIDFASIREAVAGGPRLLQDGKINIALTEEKMSPSFSTTRHPRSAVGITPEGKILFLTVDGREKGISRGASLQETAELLLKLGAVEAVNMDGGGSTTLVAVDSVINSPSEGKERPVSNMLLVFGKRSHKTRTTDTDTTPVEMRVGETHLFSNSDDRTLWGTAGGIGFVNQEGTFHAIRPGKGVVYCTRGTETSGFPIMVRGAMETGAGDATGFTAQVSWANQISENNYERVTVKIRLTNAEGDSLSGEAIRLTVVGGVSDSETLTTNVRGEASALIRWTTAPVAERSVTVFSPNKRFLAVKTLSKQ